MAPVLKRVLVAIDPAGTAGTAGAKDDPVVGFALRLARRYASDLLFCAVVDVAAAIAETSDSAGVFFGQPVVAALSNDARDVLAGAARRASEAGVNASSTLLEGRPVGTIVTCANQQGAAAIVMGTQTKRGIDRLLLGSTAQGVLRSSLLPTFVVPAHAAAPAEPPRPQRVLVAIDDSPAADAALDFAIALGAAGDRIICCHIVDATDLLEKAATYGYDPTPFLRELRDGARTLLESRAARVRDAGIDADTALAEGRAIDTILESATLHGADFIAIGTHARRGIARMLLGSVAEGLIRRASLPVVAVRTTPET